AGIHQFNVESFSELKRLNARCDILVKKANVVLRVNPNVSVDTHPYIATGMKDNKFGIGFNELQPLIEFLKNNSSRLNFKGLSSHLGSQLLDFSGIQEALTIQKNLFYDLKKQFPNMNRFDVGGGVGILYENQDFDSEFEILKKYGQVVQKIIRGFSADGMTDIEFQSEPGRFIVAHGGVLICQVQYIKKTEYKTFVVLDSGMNHLMRPSLYQAYHPIYPLFQRAGHQVYDFVGPICESSDFFAKNRPCSTLEEGDFVAVGCAGAYGSTMANRYNLHEMPDEVVLG
ncbi:MAG: diaminopimelate decarboxylase, partial [Pseudobdellovibrionaceae bacterium]